MKVLFLDMDGVLNSDVFFRRTIYRDDYSTPEHLRLTAEQCQQIEAPSIAAGCNPGAHRFISMIDPDAVALLNDVVEKTCAKVVLSSSWRIPWDYTSVQLMLEFHGWRGELIDRTPSGVLLKKGDEYARGHEIQAWLDAHPEVTQFAIVDDSSDMAHLLPRLVQTTYPRGLLREHADELIIALS